MIKKIRLITFNIIGVLTLIVVLQNTESVGSSVLFWKFSMPPGGVAVSSARRRIFERDTRGESIDRPSCQESR